MSISGRAPILELRHIECEPPAAYLPALQRYANVQTVRTWCEDIPGDPRDFTAVIAMGGPMGVNDCDEFPWISEEVAFLRRAVDADVPVWGVCLGSQLLAAALGARVWTGPVPEVGVLEVIPATASTADPVWKLLANSPFQALQWHSDTFDLPPGATRLAGSARYPNQVFQFGNSYGVQFHFEADTALAEQWLAVPEYHSALVSAIGADAIPRFMDDLSSIERTTRATAAALITRWLDHCVDHR